MRILLHALLRILDADLPEKFHGLVPCLLLRGLVVPDHTFHDLLSDLHRRIETRHRVLEDHRNPLSVDVASDPLLVLLQDVHRLLRPVRVVVGELDRPAVHPRVVRKDAHRGLHGDGLSGAGLADDGDRLPFHEIQVDAADGVHLAGTRLERDVEIPDL